MLPEGNRPIVPLDPALSGKGHFKIVGGNGRISTRDVYSSFDSASRSRYRKIILKALAVQFALAVVGIFLVKGELALLY
jgi:hypothetical protein